MEENQTGLTVDTHDARGRAVRLYIPPGCAAIREDGALLAFSLVDANGSPAGNYYLEKHAEDAYDRAEKIAKVCLLYGLIVYEGKYISKKGMSRPVHFATWATQHAYREKLVDILASWARKALHHEDYGYYDMATQELVIPGVIKVRGRG